MIGTASPPRFVIVDDFVGSPQLPALLEASRRIVAAANARDGRLDLSKGYVHRASARRKESIDRPQWSGGAHTFEQEEAWAIRGLIHPAWHEPVFAEFCASAEVLCAPRPPPCPRHPSSLSSCSRRGDGVYGNVRSAFVKRWTGCEPGQLTHGDPSLFCAPTEADFSEGWFVLKRSLCPTLSG